MYHGTVRPQRRLSRSETIQVQMIKISSAGRCIKTVMKNHAFTGSLPSFLLPSFTSLHRRPIRSLQCRVPQISYPPHSAPPPGREPGLSHRGHMWSGTGEWCAAFHALAAFLEHPTRDGRDRWIRTTESGSQIPVPYRLAMSPCRRGIFPLPGKRSAVPPDDA